MLYLATANEQPTFESADLNIETVEYERVCVQRLFSLPFVRFVGAHTGCSCGFPSIKADEPVEYYDGMFWDSEDRQADVTSLEALLAVVRGHVTGAGAAELYAVWQGEETLPSKGSITLPLNAITVDRFFFIERFLYRIIREPL